MTARILLLLALALAACTAAPPTSTLAPTPAPTSSAPSSGVPTAAALSATTLASASPAPAPPAPVGGAPPPSASALVPTPGGIGTAPRTAIASAPAGSTTPVGTPPPAAPSPASSAAPATDLSPTSARAPQSGAPTPASSGAPGTAATASAPRTTPAATPAASGAAGATTATAPDWTFEPLRVEGAAVRRVAAVPGSDVLYAATASGLYRLEAGSSARLGTEAPPNLLALDVQRVVGGASPACARGGGESPLRFSTDGGRTWRDATAPSGVRGATPRTSAQSDVLALSCGGLLWSRDGGATYSAPTELALPNFEPRDVALSADGRSVYAALVSEGGTLRVVRADRTDTGWAAAREIDTGWGTAALAVDPDGRVYLATAVDAKVSSDRGATWRSIATGLEPELLAADPSKGPLSDADARKLREGVGATDLTVMSDTLYAATAHGLYARVADAPWRRVPGVSAAQSLAPTRDALYVEADNAVLRLTRS